MHLCLDISANSKENCNIYLTKSKFAYRQPETNQGLIIEAVAIVSYNGNIFSSAKK